MVSVAPVVSTTALASPDAGGGVVDHPRPTPASQASQAALNRTVAPQPNWTPAPTGSTTLVFREAQIGSLPARGRRDTWTLIRAGASVLLRVEAQSSIRTIHDLDAGSLAQDQWHPPERTEYAGTARGTALKLTRNFGDVEPKELALTCTNKTIDVHSAFVTLVKGWTFNDDSMQPASWAPPRVERVTVLNCKSPSDSSSNFHDGLSFSKPKRETTKESEMVGVEWVFVNSDMVIQQGGYRWLPDFSVRPPSPTPP